MEKSDIEELRGRVKCAAVLEAGGFALDAKESTRGAMKFRRDAEIVIVNHHGMGWFDPLSDAKGDVFSLAAHLHGGTFPEILDRVAALVGFIPSEPKWVRPKRDVDLTTPMSDRWQGRRKPWPGSMTWRYLRDERYLPEFVLRMAIRQNRLREGPHGSMWAAHTDNAGRVTGWEERGPEWRGFSTGGGKNLFRLGELTSCRVCVTEAAIDAMSLAVCEGLRRRSLYVSTGGGWSPATEAVLRGLAGRTGTMLVAATDADPQGDVYAERIREIAASSGCDWLRLRPPEQDWNLVLRSRYRNDHQRKPSIRDDGRSKRREVGV